MPELQPTEVMTLGVLRMKYGRYLRGNPAEEYGPGGWIKPTIVVGALLGGIFLFAMFVSTPPSPRRRRSHAS